MCIDGGVGRLKRARVAPRRAGAVTADGTVCGRAVEASGPATGAAEHADLVSR
jgi:hypothetical protein